MTTQLTSNMKRMFVIYGQMNSGKTHTMWLVLHYLRAAGAELVWFTPNREQYMHEQVLNHPEPIEDFSARLIMNGRKVSIWSAGDFLDYFQGKMDWAEKHNADFIVCTARSVNREGSVLHELKTMFRNDINWWERVVRKQTANWLIECDAQAKVIAQRLMAAVR